MNVNINMDINVSHITQLETDIMEILWEHTTVLSTACIANVYLKKHGCIKPQKLNYHMKKLYRAGLITYVKIDKQNHYVPLIPKDVYLFIVIKASIEKLLPGGIKEMISLLLRVDGDMKKETLDEIRAIVDEAAELCADEERQTEEGDSPYVFRMTGNHGRKTAHGSRRRPGRGFCQTRQFCAIPRAG